MNLVTIATYSDLSEAEIIKGRLEAEGIRVHLQGATISPLQPIYTSGPGAIKLQVWQEDEDKALEIIGINVQFDYYKGKQELYLADAAESKLIDWLTDPEKRKRFFAWLIAGILVLSVIIYMAATE